MLIPFGGLRHLKKMKAIHLRWFTTLIVSAKTLHLMLILLIILQWFTYYTKEDLLGNVHFHFKEHNISIATIVRLCVYDREWINSIQMVYHRKLLPFCLNYLFTWRINWVNFPLLNQNEWVWGKVTIENQNLRRGDKICKLKVEKLICSEWLWLRPHVYYKDFSQRFIRLRESN